MDEDTSRASDSLCKLQRFFSFNYTRVLPAHQHQITGLTTAQEKLNCLHLPYAPQRPEVSTDYHLQAAFHPVGMDFSHIFVKQGLLLCNCEGLYYNSEVSFEVLIATTSTLLTLSSSTKS